MAFGDDLDKILPSYLVQSDKTRLKDALRQFTPENRGNEINYQNFFRSFDHLYFLQGDLVREIRMSLWDEGEAVFNKVYTDALVVSNTCDLSSNNRHEINQKQCILAPLVNLEEYISDLMDAGYGGDNLNSFLNTIKAQQVSNLLYLPVNNGVGPEYIVLLDNVFWFPTSELNSYKGEIRETRIASLNHFGYYLFILKLSYHLCRLPEQCDRI